MFLAGRPLRSSATISKLPTALTRCPSLWVARTVSVWTPGLANEKARCDTTAAFTSFESVRPVVTTLVVFGAGRVSTPSTRKRKSTSVVSASSRTVACRSKRCPGRKRAITGPPCLLDANSSLGGVSRETLGAAQHSAGSARVSRAQSAVGQRDKMDGMVFGR